jgi:3-dehydroquinate dehydratase-2
VVLNPGGWSHTSVVLRDALAGLNAPLVEVHISNIHRREEFRRHSYVSGIADGVIAGLGVEGYVLALQWMALRGVR